MKFEVGRWRLEVGRNSESSHKTSNLKLEHRTSNIKLPTTSGLRLQILDFIFDKTNPGENTFRCLPYCSQLMAHRFFTTLRVRPVLATTG